MPAIVVLLLALLAAISPLATAMYLPALPQIAADLSTDAATVQLTMTTFMAGLAVGQLVIGPLSDRTGRRPPLVIGAAVCVLASLLCALAPSIGVLVAVRFLQGFAGAAGVVVGRAIVADSVRGAVAARTFSWLMTIGAVAPVVAPLLGGVLLGPVGWRGVFAALTAIAVVMLLGVLVVLPESLPPARRHAGGARATLRGARQVLSNRQYLGHTLTFACSYGTLLAYVSASPFVLQEIFGLSPGWYSVAFAANAGGLTLANLVNARLVGRIGAARLLRVGLGWEMATVLALLVLTLTGSLTLAAVLALFWSSVTSLGLVMGNATSLALGHVPERSGTGSAVLGAGQFALAALVAPVVGLGGEDTALPMALTMVVTATLAIAASTLLTTRGTGQDDRGADRVPRTEAADGRGCGAAPGGADRARQLPRRGGAAPERAGVGEGPGAD